MTTTIDSNGRRVYSTQVLYDWLKAHPGERLQARDAGPIVAEALPEVNPHSAGQTLASMVLKPDRWPGVARVGDGVYTYDPKAVSVPAVPRGPAAAVPRKTDQATFAPVLERIPEKVFDAVGLTVVARAADGGFVATDEQGTAWKVTVTFEASLV